MEQTEQISEAIHSLVMDFIGETAYQKLHLLSSPSQNLLFQMQSSVVNTQHIWDDSVRVTDAAVRRLDVSVCIRNLQTFVEAVTAARELYLVLPNHLVDYQDRAEKIIKAMQQTITTE